MGRNLLFRQYYLYGLSKRCGYDELAKQCTSSFCYVIYIELVVLSLDVEKFFRTLFPNLTSVAQLVRSPGERAAGRGFDS